MTTKNVFRLCQIFISLGGGGSNLPFCECHIRLNVSLIMKQHLPTLLDLGIPFPAISQTHLGNLHNVKDDKVMTGKKLAHQSSFNLVFRDVYYIINFSPRSKWCTLNSCQWCRKQSMIANIVASTANNPPLILYFIVQHIFYFRLWSVCLNRTCAPRGEGLWSLLPRQCLIQSSASVSSYHIDQL